jgi:2-oxoglutarate dehydrogenase E2 component (dihydrolipoamide succinyltransferase)
MTDLMAASRHRTQAGVAAAVARSHATIPPGFTLTTAEVDRALAFARAATRRLKTLIGLTELLVKAIGALPARFPLCYATPRDDRTVRLAEEAHVGVTIDVGTGLYAPVVRGAGALGLDRIGATLLEYRRAAMHGALRRDQLTGANIMLTLATDALFSRPMVFPDQVCALSLGATLPQVAIDRGEVAVRRVVRIGLAYDHRVVNGQDSVQYLAALRTAIETLEGIDDGIA